MIKVCHVTSAHKSLDVRIFQKQCTSLAKAGYDTYLVAGGDSLVKNGVNIVGVGEFNGGRLKRMTSKARAVYKKALELDCDIYQLHDPELLPYALKLKRKGKKVIFDSHESIIDNITEKEYINKSFRFVISKIFDKYLKYVSKRIDAVITVTPHIVDYYEGISKKTVMITNYPMIKDEINCDLPNSRTIVFAGGVVSSWSHENIIKALQLVDATYNLCGPCNEAYLMKLNELDTSKKLKYKGVIPYEQSLGLINNSGIGMALCKPRPNVGGTLGTLGNTKLFEYMMNSKPIICTDFILWKEIVNKYNCGICVDPENIEEIANAINYLLDNPEIAKEMGQNGRRAIEQEFNWDIEVQKLFKLYEEIL